MLQTKHETSYLPEQVVRIIKETSKGLKVFFPLILIFISLLSVSAQAQSSEIEIRILSIEPPRVKITGQLKEGRSDWSFRNTYAGVDGLAERIENLDFKDKDGNKVIFKKLVSGEYQTESNATKFSYELKLEPPVDTSDSAFVSWLTKERGLLLLGDMLPLSSNEEKTIRVKFILPDKWKIASVEKEIDENNFEIKKLSRTVFVVSEDLRKREVRLGEMDFTLVSSGEWAFTDEEIFAESLKVLNEHKRVWGGVPSQKAMFLLLPFPRPFGATRWSAETRGTTVILLSGKLPTKLAAMLQLNTPLTHELFHLWLPNALSLEGQYDWFYEGFTLYQALRAGMRLDYFSFEDYLKSLARAYDAYRNEQKRDKLSLPEISKQRWAGANDLIYNKGMLTAFLYDLTLKYSSNNKFALEDCFRRMFKSDKFTSGKDSNAVVIEHLSSFQGMKDFVTSYIEKPATIDLPTTLAPFGLIVEQVNGKTLVKVNKKLSRSQRALLKNLGYNENLFRDNSK